MDNKKTLEHAAEYFKKAYPGLTAEAVVCFLVLVDLEGRPTVTDIAQSVRMTEQDIQLHLALMEPSSGAGLVSVESQGDGKIFVHLTDAGVSAKNAIQTSFSG